MCMTIKRLPVQCQLAGLCWHLIFWCSMIDIMIETWFWGWSLIQSHWQADWVSSYFKQQWSLLPAAFQVCSETDCHGTQRRSVLEISFTLSWSLLFLCGWDRTCQWNSSTFQSLSSFWSMYYQAMALKPRQLLASTLRHCAAAHHRHGHIGGSNTNASGGSAGSSALLLLDKSGHSIASNHGHHVCGFVGWFERVSAFYSPPVYWW